MKLELKHLAPYLPYGLKWKFDGEDLTHDIVGLDITNRGVKLVSPYNDYGDCEISYGKPLLLPMSSLYTEITHNGKTFIPQKELDWGSWNDEIGYIVSAEYGENPRVAINVLDFIDDYYKLLEWHFDVFGLIDKGLALDKTKIK